MKTKLTALATAILMGTAFSSHAALPAPPRHLRLMEQALSKRPT